MQSEFICIANSPSDKPAYKVSLVGIIGQDSIANKKNCSFNMVGDNAKGFYIILIFSVSFTGSSDKKMYDWPMSKRKDICRIISCSSNALQSAAKVYVLFG